MNIDRYIIRAAEAYQISPVDIRKGSRSPRVCAARWAAWGLAYQDGFSLNQIADANKRRRYKGQDHTSILYGLERIGVPRRSVKAAVKAPVQEPKGER